MSIPYVPGISTSPSVRAQAPAGNHTPVASADAKRKRVLSGGTSSPPRPVSETSEETGLEVKPRQDAEISRVLAMSSLGTCIHTTRNYLSAVNLEARIASTVFASTREGASEYTGPKDVTRKVENPYIRFAA